ncbi:MAG: hypothetical protein AAF184_15575 [Pseudomonadota bacterium]
MSALPPAAQYPLLLDAGRGEIGFMPTTREALSEAPFLDGRFATPSAVSARQPIAALSAAVDDLALPPVILHTAFCCSTLLASALDHPGKVLALKEPDILMQLANLPRVHQPIRDDRQAFANLTQLVLRLLARRFAPEEQVILKPTNATANLLPTLTAFDAPVVLLYADLRAFLVSVIKKGEAGRWFVRHLMNIFRLDGSPMEQWRERERMLLTDLQVATLVWWHQIDNYLGALGAGGRAPLATLSAAAFLADPLSALKEVNAFARLGLSDETLTAAANGPAFHRHSKFADLEYDSAQREEERAQIEAQHGEAISLTLAWSSKLRGSDSAVNDALATLRQHSALPNERSA